MSQFDTDESLIYQFAKTEDIPTSLVVQKREGGKLILQNIFNLITSGSLVENLKRIKADPEEVLFSWIQKNGLTQHALGEINVWHREQTGLNKDRYSSLDQLNHDFEEWKNQNNLRKQKDVARLIEINAFRQELLKFTPLEISKEKINNRIIHIDFEFENYDPLAILDSVQLSPEVPSIVYRRIISEESSHRRPFIDNFIVSIPQDSEDDIYYTKVIDFPGRFNRDVLPSRTFMNLNEGYYLSVYRNVGSVPKETTRKSYFDFRLDMDNRVLEMAISNDLEKIIIERIKNALPTIRLKEIREVGIRASFELRSSIREVSVYPDIFAHVMLREALSSFFILIDESSKNIAFGNRLPIKSGPISATIKEMRVPHSNEVFIEILVQNAPDRQNLAAFEQIMARLFTFYLNLLPQELEIFRKLFPLIVSNRNILHHDDEDEPQVMRQIAGLKKEARDVFIDGYGRVCQSNTQPTVIDNTEVDEYEDEGYQVVPFPPIDPKFHFICEDPIYQFPGVKHNTELDNRNIYPYLPCCFKDDQIDTNKKTTYKEYYEGESYEISIGKTHQYKRPIPIGPYNLGYIAPKLDSIMKLLLPDRPEESSFRRMGLAPNSSSSLIHCILDAFGDKTYISLPYDRKENYVNQIRQTFSRMHMGLAKQEFWYLSESEIMNKILSYDEFFDPLLFGRFIEERFKINLYIIPIEGASNDFKLSVPNHRSFYAFTPRDRPTVIIFRNTTKKGKITCELLIDYLPSKSMAHKIFPPSVNAKFMKYFSEMNTVVTWSIPPQDKLIEGRKNVNSIVNYFQLFDEKGIMIYSMFLDEYGKMIGLNIVIPSGGTGTRMTVFFPPAQPENLPTSNEVNKCDPQIVINLFGVPTARSGDGLWFKLLDLPEGLFVPTTFSPTLNQYPLGSPNPRGIKSFSAVSEIHNLRREANFIVQILRYLNDLWRLNPQGNFNDLIKIQPGKYDFTRVGKVLPKGTFDQVMQDLDKLRTGFIIGRNIIAYNEKFRERLIYYIKRYNHETDGLPIVPNPTITSVVDERDFQSSGGAKIFLTERRLNMWLLTKEKSFTDRQVQTKLSFSLAQLREPYIYGEPESNRYYLIQNANNAAKAIAIAKRWYQESKNDEKNLDNITDVTGVTSYYISTEGRLVQDRVYGTMYHVLNYNPVNANNIFYAAILPLFKE